MDILIFALLPAIMALILLLVLGTLRSIKTLLRKALVLLVRDVTQIRFRVEDMGGSLDVQSNQDAGYEISNSETVPINYIPDFLVGDRVLWCGSVGKVIRNDGHDLFPVHVEFQDHQLFWFTPDGRYELWHTEASLKKIVTKNTYREYTR